MMLNLYSNTTIVQYFAKTETCVLGGVVVSC